MAYNVWSEKGYQLISISIYGQTSSPLYAAVMRAKSPGDLAQTLFSNLTLDELAFNYDGQLSAGNGLVMLAATGDDPLFAAVYEPQAVPSMAQWGLTNDGLGETGSIQYANSVAKSQGLILSWAASYGAAGSPMFAGIWVPNTGNTLWTNDNVLDDVVQFDAVADAETAAWCRPAFVTLSNFNTYMSLFTADEIGPWRLHYDLTTTEYEHELATMSSADYFPYRVQASGDTAAAAQFAALFVKSSTIVKKRFTVTGPVKNAPIDTLVREIMQSYPVARHASLSIVNGTKLVYACGYTLAEPNWPIAKPTTYFRLASGSKTIAALAIFQLIEAGKLSLGDTLQGILNLQTPTGGAPSAEFAEITIQELLEDTSGVQDVSLGGGIAAAEAIAAATGNPLTLPATQQMMDSYIASLPLANTPNTQQTYNNTGYYLLGRVVAELYGTATPVDAYVPNLFKPLGIRRIRSAVDLISGQLPNEARYQAANNNGNAPWAPDLELGTSDQSVAQPLVASGYGDYDLALNQGCAGMSAATTDLARLVAIMIDLNDNPALKRSTLDTMLGKAATLWHDVTYDGLYNNANDARAGYGLDAVLAYSGGSYYGQKGGLINDAASVLDFNYLDNQWGFVLCFGSPAQLPGVSLPGTPPPVWYPDFTSMMSDAMSAGLKKDLFPHFGMSAL